MEGMTTPATKQDVQDIVQAVADDIFQVLEAMMSRIDDRFNQNELRIAKLQVDVASMRVQLDTIHNYLDMPDNGWKWSVD